MDILTEGLGMKKVSRFSLLLFLLLGMLWGCSDGGGYNENKATPPTAQVAESTAVNLTIINTLTGAPQLAAVAATPLFTVTISGLDAGKIVDGKGTPTTTFTDVKNFLTFYIRAATSDYPLNLRVVVKNSGFITNSQTLVIEAPISTAPVLLPIAVQMTPITMTAAELITLNAEVGIDVQSEPVQADATGLTTSQVVIATTPIPTTTTAADGSTATGSGTVQVTIPAGTGLKTIDNQPVTGALTATVTYHNPIDASSLATFPGGLTVQETPSGVALAAGEPPASFISGGFTSIEIVDANGNEVRNFATPIVVTMTVPRNLGNPETGLPMAAGDVVPLWSYDTDSGKWTVHYAADGTTIIKGIVGDGDGDGVVDVPAAQDVNGDWLVAFPTTHLSYFNLDWFAWYQNVPGATALQCATDPTLTVVGAQGQKIFFLAEAIAGGFSHDAWLDANPNNLGTQQTTIWNAPTIPMRYTAYLNYKSAANKLNSVDYTTLCGGVTFNVVLPGALPTYADVNINVYDRCSNDLSITTPVPSVGVMAINSSDKTNYLNAVTNAQGSALLKALLAGKSYTITAESRTGGVPQTTSVTVGTTGSTVNVYFPQTCVIEDPTGTGGTGGTTGGTL
jgi:hypothetical protein